MTDFIDLTKNLLDFGYAYFYSFPDNIISAVNKDFGAFANEPDFYKEWWRFDFPGQVRVGYDNEELSIDQFNEIIDRGEEVPDSNIIETFKYRDSIFKKTDEDIRNFDPYLSWIKNLRMLQTICKTISVNILDSLNKISNQRLADRILSLKDNILDPNNDNHFTEVSLVNIEEIIEPNKEKGFLSFRLLETHPQNLYFWKNYNEKFPYEVPSDAIVILLGRQAEKMISSNFKPLFVGGDFRGANGCRKYINTTIAFSF